MRDGGAADIEAFCPARITLRDHLATQVALGFRDPVDAVVASEIIESLDADGYLRRDLDEIAEALGAAETRVAAVLAKVQQFDPAGIGARNLAECLRLQLADRAALSPEMSRLLDNLPLLAAFDHARLARICGVGPERIREMARVIRTLDPRPGRRFDHEPLVPALPDVVVSPLDGGGHTVELNSEVLPRVLVNRAYYAEVKARSRDKADRRFVVDCMQNASWLVRNLDQRARTILRVSSVIVDLQAEFFALGVEGLRPLRLRDVADAIGAHESTVCRAIANKHMLTPRGLYPLKFFFTNAIAAAGAGDELSATTVRHRIRQMVDAEPADAVLSDDDIVAGLRDAGIEIARRTVAKYREMMRIPCSLRRRRQKRSLETC